MIFRKKTENGEFLDIMESLKRFAYTMSGCYF